MKTTNLLTFCDWQHIVEQHLVNYYMVLCKKEFRSYTSNVVPISCIKILNVKVV